VFESVNSCPVGQAILYDTLDITIIDLDELPYLEGHGKDSSYFKMWQSDSFIIIINRRNMGNVESKIVK